MEPVPHNVRLVRRAYWLMRLRWVAIVGVLMAVFVAEELIEIPLASVPLYSITALLGLYNLGVWIFLRHFTKNNHDYGKPAVKRIINFQMSADLIFLTVLLHFAGGIQNPFVVYFVFHMIIASILLSPIESYLQATLGTGLILLMTLLEYQGIIAHYHLEGFLPADFHTEGFYLFSKVGILSSALYLVVFMTSSIAVQARKQEEGYRLANIELEKKDRVKDEYVARVTHDIKGHLAAIKSCLDVLDGGIAGDLNEKQAEFVSRAVIRFRNLTNFVKSLLKLTRIRLMNKVETHPFDVAETIDKAFQSVQIRADEKSVKLNKILPDNFGQIVGDAVSVEELIANLMLNAIKYTPDGGSVSVKAEDKDKFVEFEISDTGIGIPDDEIGHVFDEFYRASNARKTEKDGTGMGLPIAKQIVESHGGTIKVTSAIGKGTTFTFTLARKTG